MFSYFLNKKGELWVYQRNKYFKKLFCPKTVSKIARGTEHCLALSSDGNVYSWTSPHVRITYGELGLDHYIVIIEPIVIPFFQKLFQKTNKERGNENKKENDKDQDLEKEKDYKSHRLYATQISCGPEQSFVLLSDSSLYVFGRGTPYSLGFGKQENECTPKLLDVGVHKVYTSAKNHTFVYELLDGTFKSFGRNNNSQCAAHNSQSTILKPTEFNLPKIENQDFKFKKIYFGNNCTLVQDQEMNFWKTQNKLLGSEKIHSVCWIKIRMPYIYSLSPIRNLVQTNYHYLFYSKEAVYTNSNLTGYSRELVQNCTFLNSRVYKLNVGYPKIQKINYMD